AVPDAERIPEELNGFSTDVVEARVRLDQLPDDDRYPTVLGGISLRRCPSIKVGTLGCLVRDNQAGGLWLVTCAHVFGAGQAGDMVIQPAEHGRCDSDADRIGAVEKLPPPQNWTIGAESGW